MNKKSTDILDVEARDARAAGTALTTGDAEARDPTLPNLPTDPNKPLRIGLWVLILGFGGFLLWAALAPLDSGVPATGNVAVDGRRKSLQHLSGGVIKEILVREGSPVKEGAVLLRMDDSLPLATRSAVQSELKVVDAQIAFLEKLTTDLKDITEQGYYPRNRALEIERQLTEAYAKRQGLRDRLSAAIAELERAVIRAPASGRVMGVTYTTEGAVVPPGGKLMDVVPDDERLVIEAQIDPHLIDRVTPGLQTEVRFSTLNTRATPIILGVVDWVSADKFQDPNNTVFVAGYYTARVLVSPQELQKLGSEKIRPGLPAEVIIRTGERTFLQYLVKPLTDRMATSLKER